jgi:molybdopterin molybdotransferase
MKTIGEAQVLAVSVAITATTEMLPLHAAVGRVLARDVFSQADHPAFDNSAVDGYVYRFSEKKMRLRIVGEVKAGDHADFMLLEDECVRIFTGAKVPGSADTVVMQEYAKVDEDGMTHSDEKLKKGGNIRRRGEQLREGETAMKAGEKITPAAIGHLASLGVGEVEVYLQPRVSIFVTGSEFAKEPGDLAKGKIFESNGQMLTAALAQIHIKAGFTQVHDDLGALTAQIADAKKSSDVLLVTGGVSVGDYDFTKSALEANGFETVFHGVKQQPGKPLLMMRCGDKIAWGLPGNPRSVLVCFYMYAWPSLWHWMGATQPFLPSQSLQLAKGFLKKNERDQLLTAVLAPDGVLLDGQQNSNMLGSFAVAQAIAHLPAAQSDFPAGCFVEVTLLPS